MFTRRPCTYDSEFRSEALLQIIRESSWTCLKRLLGLANVTSCRHHSHERVVSSWTPVSQGPKTELAMAFQQNPIYLAGKWCYEGSKSKLR
jgi:hypothetical protein